MVTHSFAGHLACPGIRPVVLEGKSLTSFPFNTSNSIPASAACKGFFAGLTLFDLFFFFLTFIKKYQKVQFAYFTLDKNGVLVYGKKKFLNQESSAVERRGGRGSHATESQAQTKNARSMNKIEKMNTGTVFEYFRSKNILL